MPKKITKGESGLTKENLPKSQGVSPPILNNAYRLEKWRKRLQIKS